MKHSIACTLDVQRKIIILKPRKIGISFAANEMFFELP